jgi:octaprenyl-diphosphate synthase
VAVQPSDRRIPTPPPADAAALPPEVAAADLRAIEESLARFQARHASRIGAAARHLLDAGGKRLRPLLTCTVARALGHDPRPQVDLVAAVELVHAGSLLHDDVIDGAELRRGRRSVHAAFDAHTAILAGDFLFSWAFDRLARDGSRTLQIALGDAIRELCEGEVLERERRFDDAADLTHVRLVNRLKTAGLFAYAAEAGALLAGVDGAVRAAARAYGLALGEAFQTVDDLLDWEGDDATLGKPHGRDLAEGLVTVPVALGVRREPALRDAVRRMWRAGGDGGAADASEVRGILERVGAFAAARQLAEDDAARAGAALAGLPAGPWRERLSEAARRAVARDR